MNATPFVAEVTDYMGLVAALRARISELGYVVAAVGPGSAGHVAGLPDGYLAKLMTPGRSERRLGMLTLGAVLAVLGVKLFVVADHSLTARMSKRIDRRQAAYVRGNETCVSFSKVFMRENGIKGGHARAAKMTAKQRSEAARKAVKARHAKASPEQRSEAARHAVLARWSQWRARREAEQASIEA